VLLSEVTETDTEMSVEVKEYFEHHFLSEEGLLSQRQDTVFVQYNHCFLADSLYLYWPLLWNLK
jgi:hypothetical protein